MSLSVIFLAGGKGERMGTALPKQYLPLKERPLVLHSLEVFFTLPEVDEVIVVCAPDYQHHFSSFPVRFAQPGRRRQDSVYNGLLQTDKRAEWICVHDGARPFINRALVTQLLAAGKKTGAATLALPSKNTLKQCNTEQLVEKTVDRSQIWEVQTPQLLKKQILIKGFAQAGTTDVTDDVSLAELIGHPVQLVRGSDHNIKITTPQDLVFAEWLLATNSVSATMEHTIAAGKCSPTPVPSKS
ncbi:MAG: 2-C-methyl-D-erythritol 4-phosphate cytidylyltransferase [Chlamydiales bacterium]|nr:2-C-methyl-D-erythritol 4-phosphate cytidylyltransferase [Chlamydiales bacterium]